MAVMREHQHNLGQGCFSTIIIIDDDYNNDEDIHMDEYVERKRVGQFSDNTMTTRSRRSSD